jgi:hypothetical protein
VVATLKPGQRHIYAKRDFYIDEDTWQAAVIDQYDGRGQLWRVAEPMPSRTTTQVPWYTLEALYDLQSGRYLALGMKNEEKLPTTSASVPARRLQPAALRQAGIR